MVKEIISLRKSQRVFKITDVNDRSIYKYSGKLLFVLMSKELYFVRIGCKSVISGPDQYRCRQDVLHSQLSSILYNFVAKVSSYTGRSKWYYRIEYEDPYEKYYVMINDIRIGFPIKIVVESTPHGLRVRYIEAFLPTYDPWFAREKKNILKK